MEAGTLTSRRPRPRARDRLAAGFLLLLLAIGSLVLWIGIPWGGLWLTGEVAETSGGHLVLSLLLIPTTMIIFGLGLAWVNGLYLRITGATQPEEDEPQWRVRGPLETFIVASLIIAITAMLVWFFVFAENPPSCSSNRA